MGYDGAGTGTAQQWAWETTLATRRPDKTPDVPRRTPAALIELIQAHLGEELGPQQVDELREKLDDRPDLQEALQAELSAQEAPSSAGATTMSFDELIGRVEALAAGLRPKSRLLSALGGAVVLLLSVTIILVVFPLGGEVAPPGGEVAVSRPTTGPTTRLAAASRPATRPTTRLAAASRPATRPTTRLAAASRPATRPTTRPHVPAAPSPMTWQEYALPDTKGAFDWQGGVEALFEHRTGKKAALDGTRKYLTLDGTYRLGAVPARGRMVRLGMWEVRQFALELWNGNAGVRLQMDKSMSDLRGYTLTRDRPGAKPAITGAFDDRGAWLWYGRGAIDLRYQNAQLLICRGEVPLLRLPMPKPPAEGSMTCSALRMWLAEARDCRPLPLTRGRTDETAITSTSAGKLAWQMDPEDKTKLAVGGGREVGLSGEQDTDEGRAWFVLDVPAMGSVETTIHVRDCTPLAGIFVRAGESVRHISLHSHKSKRVVGSGKSQQMAEDIGAERTVGKEFRVRIRFGLDAIMVWISPDGRTWWPRREQPVEGRPGKVRVGLEILRGKGPRRVAVDDVTIRRFGSIRRMVGADGDLVAEAAPAVTNEVMSAPSRAGALAILERSRRDDVDAGEWRRACDVHLAGRSRHWAVRGEALRELFLARCRGADTDVEAVLAALREVLDIAHADRSELLRLVRDVLGALGRTCLDTGRTRQMKAVMDATFLRPGPMGLPGAHAAEVMPPSLLSLYMLDLMVRGEWKSVRLEALRAIYMSYGRAQAGVPPLVKWALTEAEGRLRDTSGSILAAVPAWRHPLVVDDNREMLNLLGEFVFLVKDKHYESACKIITTRALGDALVSLGVERDILQTSHFLIRDTIDSTPELGEILRQRRYTDIGMIRLERARKQNDVAAIKSLAVQFHGTEPGLGAMHVLADRDLSTGDFRGAADRYKVLQGEPNYPRRSEAAAKYRLAWAMLGRLAGRPVTKPVVLSGGTFSARQFEQMIQQLASARKSADQALKVGLDAPAPARGGGTEARLTHLADVSGASTVSGKSWVRPTCFSADGDRLIVSHAGRLFAIDPGAKRTVWTFEPDPKRPVRRQGREVEGPARLLRVNDRLYVRCAEAGRPLACFETKSGTRLWSRQYDDRVLSDPVLVGPSISVITARHGTSGALYLRRVSAEGNELSPSLPLAQVVERWSGLGRPAVVDDAILFRTGGCLVNCSHRGALRWARRLPMVPPEVIPELYTGMTLDDMLVWRGRNGEGSVILSAPGSPYVLCVSARNGRMLWSRLIRWPARVVGLVGGRAIVLEADRICALDPATGKVLWQHLGSIEKTAVLPGDKGTLVLVRLDKPGGAAGERREIRWLSAKSGDTHKVLRIDGDPAIYDVSTLFSDGKRIFGLSNFNAGGTSKGKIFMIEIPG